MVVMTNKCVEDENEDPVPLNRLKNSTKHKVVDKTRDQSLNTTQFRQMQNTSKKTTSECK